MCSRTPKPCGIGQPRYKPPAPRRGRIAGGGCPAGSHAASFCRHRRRAYPAAAAIARRNWINRPPGTVHCAQFRAAVLCNATFFENGSIFYRFSVTKTGGRLYQQRGKTAKRAAGLCQIFAVFARLFAVSWLPCRAACFTIELKEGRFRGRPAPGANKKKAVILCRTQNVKPAAKTTGQWSRSKKATRLRRC